MIYPVIALLTLSLPFCLFIKRDRYVSIIIVTTSILSIFLLVLSLEPGAHNTIVNRFPQYHLLFYLPKNSISANIFFALTLAVLTFSEIISLSSNSEKLLHRNSSVFIVIAVIFSGIFFFTTNIFLMTLAMFTFTTVIFFSKLIDHERSNFSYIFWNILGCMSFLVASVFMLKAQLFNETDFLELSSIYLQSIPHTDIENLQWTHSTLLSILFFISIILSNSLFPMSYLFSKNIDTCPPSRLLLYFLPNIFFLGLIVKFKSFNPLLLEALSVYALANIVIHSFNTMKSRSLKRFVFHSMELLLAFIMMGMLSYSKNCFYASLYLIATMGLIYISIIFILSLFDRKGIPTSLEKLKDIRINAPGACLSISVLIVIFVIPAGPYFPGVVTVLRKLTEAGEHYLIFLSLPFLVPSWTGFYLIFKLFFAGKESLLTEDISPVDLVPILPVLAIIVLILIKSANHEAFHALANAGMM